MVLNARMKFWEIIADSLSKAGWSWGWVCVRMKSCVLSVG